MNKQVLSNLIHHLTGKLPNPIQSNSTEDALLKEIVSVKNPLFDVNEFNEILLIYNKDRISKGFFQFFFLKSKQRDGKKLTFKQIEEGVGHFRKLAMLAYGNFIYAYRTLSKLTYEQIEDKLKIHLRNPKEIIQDFKRRTAKLQNIKKVGINDVHLLGYLSREGVELDFRTIIALINATESYYKQRSKKKFCEFVINHIRRNETKFKSSIISRANKVLKCYFDNNSIDIKKFNRFLYESFPEAERLYKNMPKVETLGKFNFAVYLTWDYMDIYLATSMRKNWEFEGFYKFSSILFKDRRLKALKLRYFDPTQCYDDCRIQKGLAEGLMLKRAKCTIYSIQEIDSLGKDSELATTLAQGKPVIAYVPEINIEKYSKELSKQPVDTFTYKIRLLLETFEKEHVVTHCLKWLKTQKGNKITDSDGLEHFLNTLAEKINKFNTMKVWNSFETPWAQDKDFKKENGKEFRIFCFLIAIADKYFYDGRAKTLKEVHPLGLQVNLNTGVANGVLVVRRIDKCAALLYNILTNQLDLKIRYEEKLRYWYLQEKISGCIFGVVVDNLKLTNSFWNFYNKTEAN